MALCHWVVDGEERGEKNTPYFRDSRPIAVSAIRHVLRKKTRKQNQDELLDEEEVG